MVPENKVSCVSSPESYIYNSSVCQRKRRVREKVITCFKPTFFLSLSLSHTNIHPCFNYDKQMSHLGIAENTDSLTLHSLTRPTATHTQPSTQLLLNKVDIKELENATGRRCQEEGVHYNKDVFCTHLKG